jgi:hypothetical protein
MERIDTHEHDPERRKDEGDILGKMMNMIGSLREELSKLWTRNAVLEKELADLRPREDAVCHSSSVQDPQPLLCGDESDRKETLKPSADEGDGGKAVQGVDDVCPEVKCVHCDALPQDDKSCCGRPACEECDEFGKFAKKLGECEVDV